LSNVAVTRSLKVGATLVQGLALWLLAAPALAQQAVGGGAIYTCVDDKGQKRMLDRPIPECNDREQTILNKDGSVRGKRPPVLTPDERAEREAAERKAAEEQLALADAVRRDRNLVKRFPNEAAHNRSREASLEAARKAMKNSELRLKELAAERKPLQDEAEFFKGKKMPPRLKQQLEANDTSVAAQREAIQNQEAELGRINKLYDDELDRLRRLWGGAGPIKVTGTR
jgi:hypothetical protein